MSVQLTPVEPEYVYMTIPAEYICVYHRILVMLADFGEEMLEDCKAACKDRNSSVIDCFNMFNAAVAARKLGKESLANTLILYVKSKINQIYKNNDNSTSFIYPIDEDGQLKAVVSCGKKPIFEISPEDGDLYEHIINNGSSEHFYLSEEDEPDIVTDDEVEDNLVITLIPSWEVINDELHPCAGISIVDNGQSITITDNMIYQRYFDGVPVRNYRDVVVNQPGIHYFSMIVKYNSNIYVVDATLNYNINEFI